MEEELKREYRHIKWFVFQRLLKQKLIELLLIIFVIMFLDTSFNIGIMTFVKHYKSYWEWAILLIFIGLVIEYANKVKWHQRGAYIDNIKLYHENPKATLEVLLERRQTTLDIIKNNTDILKAFSPVPVVIFVSGLFFQDKLKDNLYVSIGFVIFVCFYIVKVYRLSKKFEECRRSIEEYKLAIHHIENPDRYAQKPRNFLS
ncbi:hypothetical protein [Priestia sp. D3YE.R1]|uniref:hypothetical protein n=1 Tax=Priestia sp. D3YE.R1 TaxID=3400416 RepID=UPI003BA24A87